MTRTGDCPRCKKSNVMFPLGNDIKHRPLVFCVACCWNNCPHHEPIDTDEELSVPKEIGQRPNTFVLENAIRMYRYANGIPRKWKLSPTVKRKWCEKTLLGILVEWDQAAPPIGHRGDVVLVTSRSLIFVDDRLNVGASV